PVECLVNNAGIADARPFGEADPDSYSREIDTNLKGVFNCTKAVLSGMAARKTGTIINISSISDRKTAPVALAYSATKHAVRAFSESLREAEANNGIRVINIAPGYIRPTIHAGMHISIDERPGPQPIEVEPAAPQKIDPEPIVDEDRDQPGDGEHGRRMHGDSQHRDGERSRAGDAAAARRQAEGDQRRDHHQPGAMCAGH